MRRRRAFLEARAAEATPLAHCRRSSLASSSAAPGPKPPVGPDAGHRRAQPFPVTNAAARILGYPKWTISPSAALYFSKLHTSGSAELQYTPIASVAEIDQ